MVVNGENVMKRFQVQPIAMWTPAVNTTADERPLMAVTGI
jgi:hypothetical protein